MKKLFIILILLVLCGCSSNLGIKDRLDVIFKTDQDEVVFRKNNYSDYIDYYLPSDIFEVDADLLSSTYSYNDAKLVVNINVAGIIASKYYPDVYLADEGFFDNSKLVYRKDGYFLNDSEELREYKYRVYNVDDTYLTYLISDNLIMYGYCDEKDLEGLSSRMLLMAKAADVKENDIVSMYSTKDTIDFEKKPVNLFETILPVNGNINDFLIDKEDSSAD